MWNDVVQNSEIWLEMRSGKLTGSAIAKVMANLGKAFGEPAKKFAVDIAVTQLIGYKYKETYSNSYMENGHIMEPIARALYEDSYFCDVTNGGFYDNGFTGCSPDGRVDDNGLVEIKSVIASQQYAVLKRGAPDPAYKWQLLFNLQESGREWIDYVSFSAEFPVDRQLIVHRIYADKVQDEFSQINARVDQFRQLVNQVKSDIGSMR